MTLGLLAARVAGAPPLSDPTGLALPPGLHLKAPDGTPMADVMLTLMHKLGLDNIRTFGDSSGAFPLSVNA